MTEEPYRWLEAIGNRREYVENQLKGGSPVFAFSLNEGVLLLGVGSRHSKVFEIFDRQALAGLGHPADLERLRQSLIDTAHVEAFTRAPADVSLRRMISFALAPQLKTAFEQIFSPPFLVRLLLAELGDAPATDTLAALHFDGTFRLQSGGLAVMADSTDFAAAAETALAARVTPDTSATAAARLALGLWTHWSQGRSANAPDPAPDEIRTALHGLTLEAALLQRSSRRTARYQPFTPDLVAPPDPTPA